MGGQGTKCRRKIAENYNRQSRVHERYRQKTDRPQTDGRQYIASSPSLKIKNKTIRMWADVQHDGRDAEYWWHKRGAKVP